eukprot:symbB.v1.2.011232.t1/scaffold751.1/size165343/3
MIGMAKKSLVGSPLPTRTKRPGSRGSFVLPRRASAGSGMKMKVAVGNKGDDADLRLAEAEQLCMLQQSALDRISMDFQHLKALIERAVMLADTERRNGVAGGNFAALLHRLREIIAANHRTPCAMTGELGPLPVAATSVRSLEAACHLPVGLGHVELRSPATMMMLSLRRVM